MNDTEAKVLSKLIAAGNALLHDLPCDCGGLQVDYECANCKKKFDWQCAVSAARQAREEG